MPSIAQFIGQTKPKSMTQMASAGLRAGSQSAKSPSMRLRDYVREAWHVVEPGTPFVSGWHIDAICEHLEAVIQGKIRNLVINIPPRHAKSLIVSVMWPTYVWTFAPGFRWLYSSYAQTLSTRDSVKCRRIIESPWYQGKWSDAFRLTGDQNQKTRFENSRTGYRIATSVGGSATGEGGDAIVTDDPHNVKEAHSSTKREAVLDWWDQVMSTRLNDPRTGRKVIVMQRVHEQDLSGHVLKQKGYVHLMLPAEFEPARKCSTSIGWADPRANENDLLWPERFGRKEIDEIGVPLGSYGRAGQLQQRPAPEGGGLFQRAWFRVTKVLPADIVARARFWDCASTEAAPGKDPDWTVGTLIAKYANGRFCVEHVVRVQITAGGVNTLIKQTAMTDGPGVRIREEEEGGSSGKAVTSSRMLTLAGFDYRGIRSTGDKITRARPMAAQAEAGNVDIKDGEWNREWLDEFAIFPFGGHDDQVDSAAGAFNELALEFVYEWGPA